MKRWNEGITLLLKSPDDFRRLREMRGYTQMSLARAVGCARSTVGHLETGERPGVDADVATALAWRLDVPLGEIFIVPEDARIEASARVQRRRRRAPRS